MPLYDFRCNQCGNEEEIYKKMKDNTYVMCKNCNAVMTKIYKPCNVQYVENDSIDLDLTGEPIVYHTLGQLKRIAKNYGCRIR